jgi:excisionase family DNA binding protein
VSQHKRTTNRATVREYGTNSRKRATKRDVARENNVSIRTVDQWIAERKIPFVKISPRLVRFDLDAVDRALERYTVKEVGALQR